MLMTHYCIACCHEDRPCTDPRLLKMSRKQQAPGALANTCLYRRLLAALVAEVKQVKGSWIAARFGLEEETAARMVEKAESEGVMGPATDGVHLVNRGQPLQRSLKKYLGIKYEVGGCFRHICPSNGDENVLKNPTKANFDRLSMTV